MGGRICEDLVDTILPPDDPDRKDQPRMAICVLSHHKLGKTIVYSLLRASGFELLDFGAIEVDELIECVKIEKIKILLISVLMTQTQMTSLERVLITLGHKEPDRVPLFLLVTLHFKKNYRNQNKAIILQFKFYSHPALF